MTFWNWRRGGGSATSGSAAMDSGTDLAPIELYTADTRMVGWIASKGQRVTDLLLASEELRLWQPRAGGEDMTVRPVLDKNGEWRTVATADVVLIMPPEWRTNRQLRLHRRIQRVAADAGPFTVTGNLHLSPGTTFPDAFQLPDFVPLTEAHLLHHGDPAFEHVVSVVIVNTTHVSRLVPLVSLA
ncbi:MAG TPA: hypothetical protein VMK30_00335 [Pleomorphomonadaceae bacterium]|nr:hypothetical protein [Pleomorphomonadaceae bacterium]